MRNVSQMKAFYFAYPILQTSSVELEVEGKLQTLSAESSLTSVATRQPRSKQRGRCLSVRGRWPPLPAHELPLVWSRCPYRDIADGGQRKRNALTNEEKSLFLP